MKKIGVSILASSLLFGAGVYAGTGLDSVKAYKNPFSISVDGEQASFKNSPLLYNNVTYLPLSELSSMLGVSVKWNERERKVEIQKNRVVSASSGTIVTANEGGSVTFYDAASQKKQEIKLMGSVHNVLVSPDGKTVWATVVPGEGFGENEDEHGHQDANGGNNMQDHSPGMNMDQMNMGQMNHNQMMMDNANMQGQMMKMDDDMMQKMALQLGVPVEKLKAAHEKMMNEMQSSGNMEQMQQMIKTGMMSDEMLKQCADLVGVSLEKMKQVHLSMMPEGHGAMGAQTGQAMQPGHQDSESEAAHGAAGKLVVIDVNSKAIIKEIIVGSHPAHVVLSPDGKYVIVTDSEAKQVSIIDAQTYRKISDVPVGSMPHGARISADGKIAYVANMGGTTVSVVDIEKGKELKQIEVGKAPVQVGITQDGKTLVATLNGENALAVVELSTGKVDKVKVGKGPAQVYIDPTDTYAYVANQGTADAPSETLSKVDLKSEKEIYQVKTGLGAHGVTTSHDGKYVYVTNMFEDTLSIVDAETGAVLSTSSIGKVPNGVTFIK